MSSYTLVPRYEWSKSVTPFADARLITPVEAVYFSYTMKEYHAYRAKESPGPVPNHEATLEELKYLVKGDMHRLPDTRYNFLLGNDGCVYEGRGWRHRPFLPAKYVTNRWNGIYITFIGDFRAVPPSDALFQMREKFLKDYVKEGRIRKKFNFIAMDTPWRSNKELYTYRF